MRATWIFVVAAACALAVQAGAQERERAQRGPGGFGPPGGPPPSPVVEAIDADSDGEISAKEIEKAAAALKKLDRNEDGKLTADELRPTRGPRGGGFGREGGREDGRGGPPQTAEAIVARWLSLDENNDGKLAADEAPERMQALITRADADKDGVATKEELTALAERQAAAGGGRGGFGGGAPGFGGPGGAPGFGPPNPEAFVDRALQFDEDGDGKLSKEELGKMAEQIGRGFGRGAGRQDGEGRGEGRPQRPDNDN